MSFAFNLGRSLGSAAATVVHGTGMASSQLVAGTKQGYASRAQELQARREALGLRNTTPVEVVDTPVEVVDTPARAKPKATVRRARA